MKTNCWLILGTMIATSAVAQVNTNKLPEIPPPAPAPTAPAVAPVVAPVDPKTNAVKKAVVKAKKKIVKKANAVAAKIAAKPAEKKIAAASVPLIAGPATVAADNVNLRGQAGLKGEVIGHVKKGDSVTVISEITLDKPKADEPAQWAKIALPSGTKVWIDSKFVDTTNNVVAVKKLNLRGGPGENYSVLGVIEKGASITSVSTKGDWTQIEAPASAFAFVAASYLKQDGSSIVSSIPAKPEVAVTEPVPPTPSVVTPPANVTPTPTTVTPPAVIPPTPTTVAEQQPIAPPATTPPPTPETVAPTAAPTTPTIAAPVTPTPVADATPATPAGSSDVDTNLPPPPPRVVTHEGSVRPSVSPVAPTYFELYDPVNDKAINYLYSTSTNLNLARYNGLHITVKGEEGLDARWQDTPVLTIQQIYVLSGTPKPAAEKLKPVKKSWFGK